MWVHELEKNTRVRCSPTQVKGKPGPKNVEDKNAKKGQTHVKKITKGKKSRDTKKNENEADETKKYA